MKKILFIALLFCFTKTQAQFVTIPDTAFLSYLHAVIPTAINGNQMDTTNAAVTGLKGIAASGYSISNLTGVQYFDSLTSLDCSSNQLINLPRLPKTLTTLACSFNNLTVLPALPNSITYIDCGYNLLNTLPALPNSLIDLYCSSNQLTSLPSLPNSLIDLYCSSNQLTSLPSLPNTIKNLGCSYNQLTILPILPNSLTSIICNYNLLTSLPVLPDSLHEIDCNHNQLTNLPTLPIVLKYLDCSYNQLTTLPVLPNLYKLFCNNNDIYCFPPFPNSLFQGGVPCPSCYQPPLDFSNNPFNCIPNYVSAMDSMQLSYPLCSTGNSNGCAVAGIKQVANNNYQITVYPNPSAGELYINSSDLSNIKWKIEITDITGRIILQDNYDENNSLVKINTHLTNGVYFIYIINSSEIIQTQKIIINN